MRAGGTPTWRRRTATRWCWDWYDEHYYSSSPEADPRGAASGDSRVFRGGGFSGDRRYLRSADRGYVAPGDRYGVRGFRVVRRP